MHPQNVLNKKMVCFANQNTFSLLPGTAISNYIYRGGSEEGEDSVLGFGQV